MSELGLLDRAKMTCCNAIPSANAEQVQFTFKIRSPAWRQRWLNVWQFAEYDSFSDYNLRPSVRTFQSPALTAKSSPADKWNLGNSRLIPVRRADTNFLQRNRWRISNLPSRSRSAWRPGARELASDRLIDFHLPEHGPVFLRKSPELARQASGAISKASFPAT